MNVTVNYYPINSYAKREIEVIIKYSHEELKNVQFTEEESLFLHNSHIAIPSQALEMLVLIAKKIEGAKSKYE